jgi:hypothetical protein
MIALGNNEFGTRVPSASEQAAAAAGGGGGARSPIPHYGGEAARARLPRP